MKILVVGSAPPPIGGNTIHVRRLLDSLTARGIRNRFMDYRIVTKGKGVSLSPLRILKKIISIKAVAREVGPDTVIHIHVSALRRFRWFAPVLFWAFKRNPIVLTIHSGSFVKENTAKPAGAGRLLARCDHVIAVSQAQADFIIDSLGIPSSRVSVIPAFIPQQFSKESLPDVLAEADTSDDIVLTSGQLVSIYNYEVLLDAIALSNLRNHFVFAFYGEREPEYTEMIYRRIADLSETHRISVVEDAAPDQFIASLNAASIYVRTTLTDGDAVAIRESLALGVPVVATDAVARDPSCTLFGTHDARKLAELLTSDDLFAEVVEQIDYTDDILGVYEHVSANDVRPGRRISSARSLQTAASL